MLADELGQALMLLVDQYRLDEGFSRVSALLRHACVFNRRRAVKLGAAGGRNAHHGHRRIPMFLDLIIRDAEHVDADNGFAAGEYAVEPVAMNAVQHHQVAVAEDPGQLIAVVVSQACH